MKEKAKPRSLQKLKSRKRLNNLRDIIVESDAVMIARGDLGC